MPRLLEAKKDVTSCEKPRGLANTNRSEDIRMGQPDKLKAYHRCKAGRTWGTETSKYPQEEKITMISGVVVSETERAQTNIVTARLGLKDYDIARDYI